MIRTLWLGLAAAALFLPSGTAGEDPYERYVNTSKDFEAVRQDKAWALEAWPGWIYMPWTYRWLIGYDEASGKWAREHGYNGAFLDHGQTSVHGQDKLAWINRFAFRFYVDHLAGKGDLHLRAGNQVSPHRDKLWSKGVRPRPIDGGLKEKLEKRIRERITQVKSSPWRAAYALDDEVSWGHFVAPCMWRLSEDRPAYEQWLSEVYGSGKAPKHEGWITYDAIRGKLQYWAVKDFDFSPLMDQWSYNDSVWCNFIGDLVEYANRIDPKTPCGIVGAQSPNAFGGYDYAKLMRKVQFIEAYNLGSSQAVIRSFNPENGLPAVTTHFHRFDRENPLDVSDSVWQVWYYLAHGNRGFIGWVENWFDPETGRPMAWHEKMAPPYREAGGKIGPLLRGAEWIHDGVALYYSHPSIQLGWILDAEAHGRTWRNRNRDHLLGSSHLVRRAWENMLRDEGLQYSFISYADVIQKGIPDSFKVLILPAVLCLSDAEARRIRAFCRKGGTVIADYLPGLFDPHGRGRKEGGVLYDLFGVRHDPGLSARDVFQERLWVDVDQEKQYGYQTFETLLGSDNTCLKGPGGFNKAVREMKGPFVHTFGKGKAVLLNLSPQWYNAFRARGHKDALRRETFMRHLHASGLERWVEIENAGEAAHGYEITYWKKDGGILLFVCFNPEINAAPTGGGHAARLKNGVLPIRLKFSRPMKDVRDERTGRKLGDGSTFELDWKMNEAVVLSVR